MKQRKYTLINRNLRNRGITLIALAITIIVLLILAGISISMLAGNNSILRKTGETKVTNEMESAKEQAKLDILTWKSTKIVGNENSELDDDIIKEILEGKPYVKELKDKSFTTNLGEYEILYSELYDGKKIAKMAKITFNANGGAISEETRDVMEGATIGTLPIPTREDYEFGGWFTEQGLEIYDNTIMGSKDVTALAQWVININDDSNWTLAEAVDKVEKDGIQVKINITKDISDNVTIANGQNIILNMQGKTLSTALTGNHNVIINNGTLEIVNGTVSSNASYSVIDNKGTGTLILKDTRVVSANKQGICNKGGGTCYIEGNSFISSESAYTIDNREGTIVITGGTVKGVIHEAVSNQGTLILGAKDGNVNIDSPIIQGGKNKNAIKNSGKVYFYDGTVMGTSVAAFNNEKNIKEFEEGYKLKKIQEVIDGTTYNLAYPEPN